MTGCKEIPGVVSVSMDAMDRKLTVRFDPRVTTRDRVIAAVEAVVDSVE